MITYWAAPKTFTQGKIITVRCTWIYHSRNEAEGQTAKVWFNSINIKHLKWISFQFFQYRVVPAAFWDISSAVFSPVLKMWRTSDASTGGFVEAGFPAAPHCHLWQTWVTIHLHCSTVLSSRHVNVKPGESLNYNGCNIYLAFQPVPAL